MLILYRALLWTMVHESHCLPSETCGVLGAQALSAAVSQTQACACSVRSAILCPAIMWAVVCPTSIWLLADAFPADAFLLKRSFAKPFLGSVTAAFFGFLHKKEPSDVE